MDDIPAAMHCARCRRALPMRTFQFEPSDGLVLKCPGCGVRHWPWPSAWLWKVPLTYSVPFSVATLSALINGRTRSRRPAAG